METVQKTAKNQARAEEPLELQLLHEPSTTLFKVSLRELSIVTLVLPLSGLFICFVTGWVSLAASATDSWTDLSHILDTFFKATRFTRHIVE